MDFFMMLFTQPNNIKWAAVIWVMTFDAFIPTYETRLSIYSTSSKRVIKHHPWFVMRKSSGNSFF